MRDYERGFQMGELSRRSAEISNRDRYQGLSDGATTNWWLQQLEENSDDGLYTIPPIESTEDIFPPSTTPFHESMLRNMGYRPSGGDADLISYLDDGRRPWIARQAGRDPLPLIPPS